MEVKLGSTDLVSEGKSRLFVIDDKRIAVFNVKGKFYAIDSRCPHHGIDLAGGELNDCIVTCPGHGWEFDVTTGEGTIMPVSVQRYEIKEKDNEIFIEI